MYNTSDTIVAISSASLPAGGIAESIIRLSGPGSFAIIGDLLEGSQSITGRQIIRGTIRLADEIDNNIEIDSAVYCFARPASYTGDDLAEIHILAATPIVEKITETLTQRARPAGPGEFTLRAYLNGRMDITQAEAVAQIVSGGNQFQLAAAQKLLAGRLCEKIKLLREEILNLLSLIEGGLDFSEDIEFITKDKAVESIERIIAALSLLLAGGITDEAMIDLPSVGLAGAPNAGKSSLLNALLGQDRSIVSDRAATTRDVLSGLLELPAGDCAIFDCAGLGETTAGSDILNELSQQAAIEALKTADVVVYCVDIAATDFANRPAGLRHITPQNAIFIATKCDMPDMTEQARRLNVLQKLFDNSFIAVSAHSRSGLDELKNALAETIAPLQAMGTEADERIAVNRRHRLIVEETIDDLRHARREAAAGRDELTAMFLRAGYQRLGQLQAEHIDEAVLDRIFAGFCIGK